MHPVGRVADQGDPLRGHPLGQLQAQGVVEAARLGRRLAEELAEPAVEIGLESLRRGRHQGLCLGRPLGPHQAGPVVGQGQDGEGAARQEVLVGHPVVRALQVHGRDHAGLLVGPADHADAGSLAHRRAAAVGGHDQRRLDRSPVAEDGLGMAGFDPQLLQPGRGQHGDVAGVQRAGQALTDTAVLQHVAERLALDPFGDLGRVEAQAER